MIKIGLERIAFQGRIWLEGYLKVKIRGTDETELRPDEDFLHIYAKRDSSDVIRLYYRGDDNVEREISTSP